MTNRICSTDKIFFFRSHLEKCPLCGSTLHVGYKTNLRPVITLSGELKILQTVLKCPNKGCPGNKGGKTRFYQAEEYLMAMLPKCDFGLDVTLYTGYLMDIKKKTLGEAHDELKKLGLEIDESTVYRQFQKYRALLAGLSIKELEGMNEKFQATGGYILSVDATQVKNSPPVLVCRELTTGMVLRVAVIESENEEEIKKAFQFLLDKLGPPAAIVSDMRPGILSAAEIVFPGVKHQYCHFHFLRNVGKGLMGDDYDHLRDIEKTSKKKSTS